MPSTPPLFEDLSSYFLTKCEQITRPGVNQLINSAAIEHLFLKYISSFFEPHKSHQEWDVHLWMPKYELKYLVKVNLSNLNNWNGHRYNYFP